MPEKIIWLRAETKPFEHRTPLIPKHAEEIVRDKHKVIVERSAARIINDNEYSNVGCEIVAPGTWPDAPIDAVILGIKELPDSDELIKHTHIYFAHAFKGQSVADKLLNRFKQGKGMLYDLEFLLDDKGKQRITSFSYWAGVAGCAVALLLWIQKEQQCNKLLRVPEFYLNEDLLISTLEQELKGVKKPSSLVVGAGGKCAKGVLYLIKKLNLDATRWYKSDTTGVSRHNDVMEHNILFNCVYLTRPTTPFITRAQLSVRNNLTLVADISCDPNSPFNPLPIYDQITTFEKPTIRVCDVPQSIDVMAIDHLPSFLPNESSCDFSAKLLSHLKQFLQHGADEPVWKRAGNFYQKAISGGENFSE